MITALLAVCGLKMKALWDQRKANPGRLKAYDILLDSIILQKVDYTLRCSRLCIKKLGNTVLCLPREHPVVLFH